MIGVSWGFPTEFYARYNWQSFPQLHSADGSDGNIYRSCEGGPIPLDKLPDWEPSMINGAYTQDDLYVEVPFMQAFAQHGVTAGWEPMGQAFAATQFPLWHANASGRNNLRAGVVAPDSGHFLHNRHADDIDWQIESDFIGLMTPALPNAAADIAFRAGHVMNYGDGVYGGVFVTTMISTAFTAGSVVEIARAGVDAVPMGTAYRAVLDQVWVDWSEGLSYQQNLDRLYQRWGKDDRCPEFGGDDLLNIDAKLNGAFILLGLLYGEGNFADSIRFAMAAGQDSDCNPSNVGSILGAFRGVDWLRNDTVDWLSALDSSLTFQTTDFTLDQLIEINVSLARDVVITLGGRVELGGTWEFPVEPFNEPLLVEQWPKTENEPPALEVQSHVDGRTLSIEAAATDDDGLAGFTCFFGDLTHASGPRHRHTYQSPGLYEVIVYVADQTGNTTHMAFAITAGD